MLDRNKKKIDPKFRFQNSNFKSRLKQARGYKRQLRPTPKGDWEILLNKIGLGSWISKISILSAIFLLVYIVYIPNIFFVKQIIIQGNGNTSSVQTTINTFLEKRSPWPQKNLLLLSKNKLADFLLQHNQNILKINAISKKFPNTLTVNIAPRLDRFAILSGNFKFIVSNDGLATDMAPLASSSLPSSLILIKLNANKDIILNQPALSKNQINFINQLQAQLAGIVKSQIDYYEMNDLQTPDLTVHFKSNFKIIFDLNADLNKTIASLKLLFSQFSDTDIKKLYYIDMRFEGRGYVCNTASPCTQNLNLPNSNASSSPIN